MFGSAGAQGFPGGAGQYYQQGNVNVGDLEDIIGSIFGGGFRRGGATGANFTGQANPFSQGARPQRGQNIEQPITISLAEAYSGTQRLISKEGRELRINIPAGADNGTKVRLSGEGHLGAGGQAGDLFLVVTVDETSSPFTRDGDDLTIEFEVDAFTAMLGGKAKIPTMDGTVTLTIPAGTQSGRKFRLAGKGMPNLKKKKQSGDLYARALITIPEQLNDEQRNLIQQLRDSFS
ncbi:MAG: J domain-containing protein [Chloroflexota bacterium]